MSNKLTATDDLFVYLLSSIDVYGANSFIDISAYNHHGKDKGELLASHIASPFNNKLGCFWKNIKNIVVQKQTIFMLIGKVWGLPSDSPYQALPWSLDFL